MRQVKKKGFAVSFATAGKLWLEWNYKNNLKDGVSREYAPQGYLWMTVNFKEDVKIVANARVL